MKIDHTKAGIRIRWGTKRVPDLTTEGKNSTAIKTYHLHYVATEQHNVATTRACRSVSCDDVMTTLI